MEPDTAPESRHRRTKKTATVVGLLCVGAFAGGMVAAASTAGAATTTTTSSPSAANATSSSGSTSTSTTTPGATSSSGSTATTTPGGAPPGGTMPGGTCTLPLSGTVTAVGSSSVTIKTASGTATYAVTSSSDIEKNGTKATSSDLAVGDAVHFSTTTTGGVTAIAVLRDGNVPEGGPGGAPGYGGPGPVAPAPSSGTGGA